MAAGLGFVGSAKADVVSLPSDPTLIDPASFHISNSTSENPVIDPVPITSTTQFFLNDNDNQTIPAPVWIFFAVPTGSGAPTITNVTYSGGAPQPTFTGPVDMGKTLSSGQDLYTVVGCSACDNSLSFKNFNDAETALGMTAPTSYEIYEAVLPAVTGGWAGFQGKDSLEFTGTFAQGTYIAPLATDGSKVYDAAFTETGVVDGPAVPEPSTWAMMSLGFAGLGFTAFRRSRRADISIVSA
jgi:hypothetical protein